MTKQKQFFGPKVKISKNMKIFKIFLKIFKIFLKIFKRPLLSPHSPHMLCIKYEVFSDDGREVDNYVMV